MIRLLSLCATLCLWPALALAQVTLDLGGTGAYGPINITTNTTLTLPPDGVLQATTVNIATGATLKFARNARNTGVVIVATGDVVINGTIDVSGGAGTTGAAGLGGPGGGNGGAPVLVNVDNYAAQFWPLSADFNRVPPVGSGGGYGSYPGNNPSPNYPYVCTTNGSGGGGGGGSLFIFSNTKITSTQSSALVTAAGGSTSGVRPLGGGCAGNGDAFTTVAAKGGDGLVRFVAPTLDAAPMTVRAAGVLIQRLSSPGLPTLQNGAGATIPTVLSGQMSGFAPTSMAVSIVSVDGIALPAGTEAYSYVYSSAAVTTTVVTNVTGCNPGSVNVQLASNGFLECGGAVDQNNFANNGSATSTWTCPISRLASSPAAARIFAYATCTQ